MSTISLAGAHTALVTPFRDGLVDEAALTVLIESQIAAGISGIVPVGTTGESPTLSHEEHRRVIEIAVKVAAKRVLVIAGTGSNATSEAVELTIEAEKLGADATILFQLTNAYLFKVIRSWPRALNLLFTIKF
jgi:4-hydroxy-tetrahydrodipicolinate synthase